MSLLCVSNSFVTAFVALELFSLALYVLVAIETDDLLSLEGGLKYLIVGSVGAAFLLYGAALTYGASGQLEFDRIRAGLAQGDAARRAGADGPRAGDRRPRASRPTRRRSTCGRPTPTRARRRR